ncbi:MAG: geranylgeranylglycerol-phosphate geranylgeranyltransferase [Luteibaculum sp.]
MKKAWHFIKLSRPLNLLIIAATLFAMRYWVVYPLLAPKGLEFISSWKLFSVLVLSIVCIAAAGNIINDYFDTKTDAINKPDRLIVGVKLDRRIALFSHGILTFLGLFLAAYYGWQTGSLRFVVLHVFVAISLWYYSIYFKRETPLGNLVIATLTGLVPFTVAFFDVFPLIKQVPEYIKEEMIEQGFSLSFYFKVILFFLLGFALFAFLGNLIREMYKDLADLEGDKKSGRRTLPIIWGENVTLWIIAGLLIIWTASLLWVEFSVLNTTFSKFYLGLGLWLPMMLSGIIAFRSPKSKTYKLSATLVKIVLLLGLGFSYFLQDIILG